MNKRVEELVNLLIDNNLTIATMESCTGGGLANEITNVSGASEVLRFSAVTYSNEFKVKMGVSAEVIDEFSVYSAQTAEEMSLNIAKFTNSDFGVGITGKLKRFDHANNAGENDVVFVCVYSTLDNQFYHKSIKVHHDTREENKQDVIGEVARMITDLIMEYSVNVK